MYWWWRNCSSEYFKPRTPQVRRIWISNRMYNMCDFGSLSAHYNFFPTAACMLHGEQRWAPYWFEILMSDNLIAISRTFHTALPSPWREKKKPPNSISEGKCSVMNNMLMSLDLSCPFLLLLCVLFCFCFIEMLLIYITRTMFEFQTTLKMHIAFF